MTDENDKKLADRFRFYTHRGVGCDIPYRFGVGDGWFDLLWKLSEKIEAILIRDSEGIETTNRTKFSKVSPLEDFRVVQIKEKFGTLRYYTSGINDEISDAITEAERASAVTCEDCGQPGVLRGSGWVFTACDDHAKGQPAVEEDDSEDEPD